MEVEFLSSAIIDQLQAQVIDDDDLEFYDTFRHHVLPREGRYALALKEAKVLVNLIADFGGTSFSDNITLLQTVHKLLQENYPAKELIREMTCTEIQPRTEATEGLTVPDVNKSPLPADILQTNADEQSAKRISGMDFILPGAMTRPPGRPKKTTAKKSFSQKSKSRAEKITVTVEDK